MPPRTKAILAAIAEARGGGYPETALIIEAVERYGRQVLGRRLAELVPIARREGAGS